MRGLENRSTTLYSWVWPYFFPWSRAVGFWNSLMSAPAANAFGPAPVMIATRMVSSRSRSSSAWPISAFIVEFRALSLSGRFRRRMPTPPLRSRVTVSYAMMTAKGNPRTYFFFGGSWARASRASLPQHIHDLQLLDVLQDLRHRVERHADLEFLRGDPLGPREEPPTPLELDHADPVGGDVLESRGRRVDRREGPEPAFPAALPPFHVARHALRAVRARREEHLAARTARGPHELAVTEGVREPLDLRRRGKVHLAEDPERHRPTSRTRGRRRSGSSAR